MPPSRRRASGLRPGRRRSSSRCFEDHGHRAFAQPYRRDISSRNETILAGQGGTSEMIAAPSSGPPCATRRCHSETCRRGALHRIGSIGFGEPGQASGAVSGLGGISAILTRNGHPRPRAAGAARAMVEGLIVARTHDGSGRSAV